MPRKKRSRKLQAPPVIKGMSVYGMRGRRSKEVILLFEEYEAIRLLDYRKMTQEEAAKHMDISRPTLTRIYEVARQKVAEAFVEGKDIIFRGGNFYFDENWYKCTSCKASFNNYSEANPVCPICNSSSVVSLNEHYRLER